MNRNSLRLHPPIIGEFFAPHRNDGFLFGCVGHKISSCFLISYLLVSLLATCSRTQRSLQRGLGRLPIFFFQISSAILLFGTLLGALRARYIDLAGKLRRRRQHSHNIIQNLGVTAADQPRLSSWRPACKLISPGTKVDKKSDMIGQHTELAQLARARLPRRRPHREPAGSASPL